MSFLNGKLAGPVFIITRPTTMAQASLKVSYKLIFEDGTQVVLAAPLRMLWSGADGTAFDRKPDAEWRIAAKASPSGLIAL